MSRHDTQAEARFLRQLEQVPAQPDGDRAALALGVVHQSELVFDLSQPSQDLPGPVYGLIMLRRGSAPNALVRVEASGGLSRVMGPGDKLKAPGEKFQLLRHAVSGTIGRAVFAVLRTPWADFEEAPGPVATVEATPDDRTVAYNSTTDTPTLATDGLARGGAGSCRAHVSAPAGATLSAGEARLWAYDYGTATWGRTPVTFPLVTGFADVWTDEFELRDGYGRLWCELNGVTNSLGAGSHRVRFFVS